MLHPIPHKPFAIGGCAHYAPREGLLESTLYETRYGDPVQLSRELADGTILVPRLLAPEDLCGVEDLRTTGIKIKPYAINCTPKNEDQARVIDESCRLLRAGRNHIIEASTGYGKTYVGVALAARLGVKVLVVVNKEDNLTNWRDSFLKFTNLKPAQIGIIQQKKAQIADKAVCIGMVHSLGKDKYGDIYDEFGLVLFDEVHHMAAETFSLVNGLFNAVYRVGMSATAGRVDGKEFIFQAHIGPVLVQAKTLPMPPKVLVVKSRFKLPLVNRKVNGEWKTVPLPHDPGKVMHINKLLAKDNVRNQLIADFVASSYRKGRYTLVLSDLAVDLHLGRLREMLIATGIPDKEIAYYVSGMSEKALDHAIGRKVVLGTYGMAGEATNVPWWSAVVMATPRANAKQAIGRGCRAYPDKPQPVILDIVDEDSWVFVKYFRKRCDMYLSEEINGTIKVMN